MMSVLLLHSSGLSSRQWRKLAGELAARGEEVSAPDLLGHGTSEPWPEPKPFTFHADVERCVAMLDGLGIGHQAHVIGHSYGGLIAMQIARARPKAVRSVTVFDPVTLGVLDRTRDADVIAKLESYDFSWGDTPEAHERWLRTFVDFWGGEGAWSFLREDLRAEFRRVAWVVQRGVTTLSADTTPASAFAVIEAPVHVVTGEHSPEMAKRIAERLREAIPNARVTTIPNAGHLAPLTHAAIVTPILASLAIP